MTLNTLAALPEPLAPLAMWPQFVAWRIDAGRKLPISPITGRLASTTNPADWGTHAQAAAMGLGVGFVFTAADPFFFLDLDKCLQGDGWSPLAQALLAALPGACVEVSQSGTGLHVIGAYSGLPPHRNKDTANGLELYTQERFVALTGMHATGSVLSDHTGALGAIIAHHFAPVALQADGGWTTEPDADWSGPENDDTLLERAMRSQSAASAFGASVTFADLWTANADALGTKWPGNNGNPYDASSADMALASQLAFWTGKNCERIDRLMRRSGLARSKWDDRPDYLETTVLKGAALATMVYKGPTDAPEVEAMPEPGLHHAKDYVGSMVGAQVMPVIFDGYVFVHGVDKILTRDGKLLGKTGFDLEHNGPRYAQGVDNRKLLASAWDAIRDNETWRIPTADGMCFRPERDQWIIEDGRRRLVNMYRKPQLRLIEGDPSKLLDHMRRMLPNGRDFEILMSYFAYCAQNPGAKVQWWPVLVGAKGSIKSTWTEIMKRALGAEFVHDVNSKQLVEGSSNFNGWIENKLFLGIDDIHGKDRREFLEGFKPTVTNRSISIEGKGKEQVTGDNRANGLMTANDPADVPIDEDERRYAPFFYSAMTVAELRAAGMDENYLGDIYSWLAGEKAYAHLGWDYGFNVMAHHLHTRPIAAEFNDVVAPATTATLMAIDAGLGPIEQAVLEMINQDEVGYAGGWVSSHYLNAFFDRRRDKITPRKRDQIMKRLGYAPHPKMNKLGQTDNRVMPDNKKVKLYCKIGSIAWNSLDAMIAVCAAYTKAQSGAAGDETRAAFASGVDGTVK